MPRIDPEMYYAYPKRVQEVKALIFEIEISLPLLPLVLSPKSASLRVKGYSCIIEMQSTITQVEIPNIHKQ